MKTFGSRLGDDRGFNITDLLASCAIFAVVSAMAVPQMVSGLDRMRLGMTLQDVDRVLQFARLKAVSVSQPIRVRFNCPAAGQMRAVEVIGTAAYPDPKDLDAYTNRCDEALFPYNPTGGDNNRLTRPNNDGPIMRLYPGASFTASQTLEFWPDGTVHTACQVSPCTIIGTTTQVGTATLTVTRNGYSKNITVNGLGKIQMDR